MKKSLIVLSLLTVSVFHSNSFAADEVSSGELCLYAGHYLKKQNGRCETPPQGSCSKGQVECNSVLFNPVCIAARSNPVGTSSECRDLSNAKGFAFVKNFTPEQKAAFNALNTSVRAYFEQERDRPGQKGIISRRKASQQNVEADEIATRYLNLKSLSSSNDVLARMDRNSGKTSSQVEAAPIVAKPQPAAVGTPINLLPPGFSNTKCEGPSENELRQCDSQIRPAIAAELSGSCQLLLIEADSYRSKKGSLRTYQWDADLKRYTPVSTDSSPINFGKGGLAYGNRYFSMAPRTEQRIERDRGQTPIGVYGGLMPVSDRVKNFRCVTDPGSDYYNLITTQDNNIGKSTFDSLQYPYALMLRYPSTYLSPKAEKNGACLMIHSTSDKSCASRGCMSMASADLEKLKEWVNWTSKPAIAILPKNEIKNLGSCLPGLVNVSNRESVKDANKSKARQ